MTFTSEVYFYARGRGLFAGAVLGGAKLDVDEAANGNFYPPDSGLEPLSEQSLATPASARRFLLSLTQAEALSSTLPQPAATADPRDAEEEATIYPLGAETPEQ